MQEPQEQQITALADALGRTSARIMESIHRTAQLAGDATPEMRELFDQWLSMLGREILRDVETETFLNVEEEAARIGISSASYLTLLVSLHRQGLVRIARVEASKDNAPNREICACLGRN